MWFDSHCHLQLCEENSSVSEIIRSAHEAGVSDLVTIGIDAPTSLRCRQIAAEYSVYFTAGVHPNSAAEWTDESRSEIESLLEEERCVGVGESGLDFYRDATSPFLQEELFRNHIDMAKRFDKALVIHTRNSIDRALEILEEEGRPDRFVFHCWSGDAQALHHALESGAYISFAGNVTFQNADDLKEAVARTPSKNLLVETDSPFLTPVPHRGKSNQPKHAALVGEALARIRKERVEATAEQTRVNARRLFGLDE
ncbi:MAG: TatD family hydrolase [Actinomycetota bacterium]|nr:TatD family hydrolase [Actinomycetota bacterium]